MNDRDAFVDGLKRRNLPTRAVRRDLSLSKVRAFSADELARVNESERAKIMILKRQMSNIRSDLNKTLVDIRGKADRLEKQKLELELSDLTPGVVKKYRDLMLKAKALDERSRGARDKAFEQLSALSERISEIERNIDVIEKVQTGRVVR